MGSPAVFLVVGSTGFLGNRVLSEISLRGYQALAPRVRDFIHDSNFWESLAAEARQHEVSVVINCAGARLNDQGLAAQIEVMEANFYLPVALSKVVRSLGASLIHIGSRWQLGERGEGPNGLYAQMKEDGDQAARKVLSGSNSAMTSVLIRDTYGWNDPRSNLVTQLVTAANLSTAIGLTMGLQRIDLANVDRLAKTIIGYAESCQFGSGYMRYEVGSETPPTVREVVEIFQQASGKTLDLRWGTIPYRGVELFHMERVHPWLEGWQSDVWRDEWVQFISSYFSQERSDRAQ